MSDQLSNFNKALNQYGEDSYPQAKNWFDTPKSNFTKALELFWNSWGADQDKLQKGLSLAQNIDVLFFKKEAPLRKEYKFLFSSLFSDSQNYTKVINLLCKKERDAIYQLIDLQALFHLRFVNELIFSGKRPKREKHCTL